mgnify:FL=1
MSKFAIGDLVTLSSAGRKSPHNSRVRGMIGIIINKRAMIDELGIEDTCPIKIKWIGLESKRFGGSGIYPMKEWEIKFAKNGVHEKH